MGHRVYRAHARHRAGHHHYGITEAIFSLLLAFLIFVTPASAAMRFQDRSLYIPDVTPGVTTSYKVSFRYMSPTPVGSVDLLFCVDPIPYHACETPAGLDASKAVLTEQLGEAGFSILLKSKNHIILSRPAAMVTATEASSYTFDNIVNPTGTTQSFSIRLRSHQTLDATGPQVDFGSVKGQMTDGVIIQTQVPPMLIFCVAEEVSEDCSETNDVFYKDVGELDSNQTLVAQSQMAVGTNATNGFAITLNGSAFSAGTNVISSLDEPTQSMQGANQFGINLVENTYPYVGKNPEGATAYEAIVAPDYSIPDLYKYVPGDLLTYSPHVSLMKKFTVSYIINSRDDIRPGVYTTTVTYIASGRF